MSSEELDLNEPEPKPESVERTGPESTKSAEATSDSTETGRRLIPNIKWLLVWCILLGSVCFLHFAAAKIEDAVPFIDQAIRNLLTGIAIMVIPFTVVLWFSFFSDHATKVIRMSTFFGFLGLQAGVIFVMANYVEFDGDLTPKLILPSQKNADYRLAVPPESNATVDLKTETPDDFPQFLGPNRDGNLPNTYFAYDWEKETPTLLWKQEIGPGHSGFATRNGFAVTMEQRGDLELTTCYKIATGELMWSYANETRHNSWLGKVGPRSTPTIHDGKVYSLGANGHLVCLKGANGELIWKKDLHEEFGTSVAEEKNAVTWGRAASPLVFSDKVVVPAGGPKEGPHVSLVCYNRNTGEELWRAGETQISYASPMLMPYLKPGTRGANCIVSVNESNVTAHDTENGDIIWSIDRPGDSSAAASTSQPVLMPGSRLLLTKGYGTGSQLIHYQAGQVETIWKNTAALKTKFTNAVYHNAYAFALSDGRLECIEISSGKRVWKSRKSYGHGQILLCGSEILVLAEKGYLALVRAWGTKMGNDANKHVQFTSFQALEGTTWNTIAVHGNKLLVRNSQEAACYEMPIRSKAE